ncbi:MAG: hypothetical protein MRERV_80c003 [Mycoplasmataceae bacterium RV_VA103A]|nr:MAG: hypothetical protein MRERV_80c003 [Mycoplasmataceae bacterium RV_VA103A]
MKGLSFQKGQEYLKDFSCSQCQLFLNDKDIQSENYSFWFSDYANEITKEVSLSGKGYVYGADFWLKGVDHEECPEWEKCSGCYSRFRVEEMKQFNDNYYCLLATKKKQNSMEETIYYKCENCNKSVLHRHLFNSYYGQIKRCCCRCYKRSQ